MVGLSNRCISGSGILLGWIPSLLSMVVALPPISVNTAGRVGRRVDNSRFGCTVGVICSE